LLGPPGAGKGTQGQALASRLGTPRISTGDILREAVAFKTALGIKAKSFMDQGALVPDDVVIGLIRDRLKNPDCKGGFILDGYPRTLQQAESLKGMLSDMKTALHAVINFELGEEVIVGRLSGRRSCPKCKAVYHVKSNPPRRDGLCDHCDSRLVQREDDQETTIRYRFREYLDKTTPLLRFYEKEGLLHSVDGSGAIENIGREIERILSGSGR
jgi:adenylate kinase